tara:strand:- start:149 stop:1195 length:1047 start_codon:yes stop_codon:yes gene_type:complete
MNKEIVFPFVGDSIGGSHVSTLELIKGIKKKGKKIRIVIHRKGLLCSYLKKKKLSFEILFIKNLPSENYTYLNFIKNSIKSFKIIRSFLKKNKNIRIIHGNDLRVNLAWSLSAFFISKNFIWHQRTLIKNKISFLALYIFLFSKKIICISQTVKNSLPFYLKGISSVVYNPIEQSKKNYSKIKKIIFLSKLTKDKGADFILDLLSKNKFKNKIYIIGSGPFKKLFKRLKNNNIKLINFTYNPLKYFGKNSIILCPSRSEGFGRVVAEGIINYSSVLASKISSHKEIRSIITNKQNLHLLNFSNTQIVKNKINKLLKSKFKYKEEKKLKYITNQEKHTNSILKIYDQAE